MACTERRGGRLVGAVSTEKKLENNVGLSNEARISTIILHFICENGHCDFIRNYIGGKHKDKHEDAFKFYLVRY